MVVALSRPCLDRQLSSTCVSTRSLKTHSPTKNRTLEVHKDESDSTPLFTAPTLIPPPLVGFRQKIRPLYVIMVAESKFSCLRSSLHHRPSHLIRPPPVQVPSPFPSPLPCYAIPCTLIMAVSRTHDDSTSSPCNAFPPR